jgi:hypothetical protein
MDCWGFRDFGEGKTPTVAVVRDTRGSLDHSMRWPSESMMDTLHGGAVAEESAQ